ncbi:MAG: long-chain fatty acid--CoA ligase [Deltaproteobacteria bacterium]|nr:long-chain fatty acid--CoA ligase [Deltaproteobacteria bacterium]
MPFTPKYTDLVSMLQKSVEAFADRPAFGFRDANGWSWIDYRSFARLVDRCRAGLASLGIGAGDRVAVISDNRLEWAVAAYASYSLSAVFVPMYKIQIEKEWKYILQDSEAKLCFVGDETIDNNVKAFRADLHSLEHVVKFYAEADDESSYRYLLETGASHRLEAKCPEKSTIASIIYTSGVRGNPKGVVLTHYNLAGNCCAVAETLLGSRIEYRTLALLPWAHVYGGAIEINTMIAIGGAIAISDNREDILDYLREVKPTLLFTVPRIWSRLCSTSLKQLVSRPNVIQTLYQSGMDIRSKQTNQQPTSLSNRIKLFLADKLVFSKIRESFGGRLSFVVCGGAALSEEVSVFSRNVGIPVYQGYGMTECGGGATYSNARENKPFSIGKPLPGVTIMLDKKVEGASDTEGEIIIFGPGVMLGYYNLPDETKQVLTEDGGIRSGDIGHMDEDGFLYITGTLKEIFKLANGSYIAPAPLEEAIQRSPYIEQCFIYGVNQSYPVAIIVPDIMALLSWAKGVGLSLFIETLLSDHKTRALIMEEIASCSRNFKSFERIRDFALISTKFSVADGTVTPTLEYKRRAIVEKYQNVLQKMYQYRNG